MWNRRSRRRGAGRSSQLLYYLTVGGLVLAAVGVLAISITPSLAFSSVGLDRPGNIGVVDDSNGVVGLDVASSVTAGSQDRLVTVTNNLNVEADITVSLDDSSQGTLYYGGSSVGDSHTVTVGSGKSVQFDVEGKLSGGDDWSTGTPCSEPSDYADNGDWNVTFYCATYDSEEDETTYKYSVKPSATPNYDLSHVVFGFEADFDPDVESTSPEAEDEDGDDEGDVKTDPVTGVYGLKFDDEVSKTGSGQTYNITIEGEHRTAGVDHGLKYGPKTATLQDLPGPASGPGSQSSGETLRFTVKSTTDELTGTLDRSVTLQSGSSDSGSGDDGGEEDDDSGDEDSDEDDGGDGDEEEEDGEDGEEDEGEDGEDDEEDEEEDDED